MAFGNVDVQLVLEHVERHPTPSQKPQVDLYVKLACVQGAGLPFSGGSSRRPRFPGNVSRSRWHTCQPNACLHDSQPASWQHSQSSPVGSCAYACSKATHISSNVLDASRFLPGILNLRSLSGVFGACVSKNHRATCLACFRPASGSLWQCHGSPNKNSCS